VTETTVRAATAADLDDVVTTFVACWHESYADLLPRHVRALYTVDTARELWRRSPLAAMLVADVADRGVLGVLRFGADPADAGRGHVFSLYVHPDTQGLGLGRALLDAGTVRLRADGFEQATLWVFADNHAAQAFYAKCGWLPDGATRVEPAYRLSEVRLQRSLG
jgi:ribosomal protein S18 acetylase RimI-like enzyme